METIDEKKLRFIMYDNLIDIEVLFVEKCAKKIPVAESYWHIQYKKRWIHDIIAVVIDNKLYMYPYMSRSMLTQSVLESISYSAILLY